MSQQSAQNDSMTLDEINLTNETLVQQLSLLTPGQTVILNLIAEKQNYIFSHWIKQEMAAVNPTKKISIAIEGTVVTFHCEI